MAQHEDLGIFGTITSTAQHEQVDHEADKTVETAHGPILAASRPDRSRQRVTPAQHSRRVLGTHRARLRFRWVFLV